MLNAGVEFIPTLLICALTAVMGWIILRSFFADPEQFMFALTVKLISFSVNLIKWTVHLIGAFIITVLGVIYIAFPLDLIPDIIVGIGWLDDLLVLISMGFFIVSSFTSFPNPSKKA